MFENVVDEDALDALSDELVDKLLAMLEKAGY